jgi:hypothetical protein
MYRIIDNRATGKTGRLMLLAKEHNAIIVCKDPNHMRDRAYAYGITGIDFMSYGEFHNYSRTKVDKPILIDELDMYLKYIENKIIGYTISNED